MQRRIEILFSHTSFGFEWRGVRTTTGGYRIDRRRPGSISYRPLMWTGNRDSIDDYNVGGAMMTTRIRGK